MYKAWQVALFLLIIVLVILSAFSFYLKTKYMFGGVETERPHAIHHDLAHELHKHARQLTEKDILGVHPLTENKYSIPHIGGAATKMKAKKHWTTYNSWTELNKDREATDEYFKIRTEVLNNPNLDWSLVLKDILPLLKENREHIGIINLDPDGKTLRVTNREASPTLSGSSKSETTFASIPSKIVAKYANMPGLFIFHTHPSDPKCDPMPSSQDLSTSIHFSAVSRFAANVVISRYGVIVYGLDWSGYQAIHNANDFDLALLNICYDVVSAHESIRSWDSHCVYDYLNFFSRYRMFVFSYPSSEMVGDGRNETRLWNLEALTDYETVGEHYKDIMNYKKKKKVLSTKKRGTEDLERHEKIKDIIDDYVLV